MPRGHKKKTTKSTGGEIPEAAADVKGVARTEYNRVAEIMQRQGTIDGSCKAILEAYADAYALCKKCKQVIEKEGTWAVTDRGAMVVHPANTVLNQAYGRMLSALRELGLGPQAGRKVGRKVDTGVNPLDEFMEVK